MIEDRLPQLNVHICVYILALPIIPEHCAFLLNFYIVSLCQRYHNLVVALLIQLQSSFFKTFTGLFSPPAGIDVGLTSILPMLTSTSRSRTAGITSRPPPFDLALLSKPQPDRCITTWLPQWDLLCHQVAYLSL